MGAGEREREIHCKTIRKQSCCTRESEASAICKVVANWPITWRERVKKALRVKCH